MGDWLFYRIRIMANGEQVGWYRCRNVLGENICDKEQAHCRLISVARQMQVFFHSIKTCIADIDSVQEALETHTSCQ
jgi:hypothetical protein